MPENKLESHQKHKYRKSKITTGIREWKINREVISISISIYLFLYLYPIFTNCCDLNSGNQNKWQLNYFRGLAETHLPVSALSTCQGCVMCHNDPHSMTRIPSPGSSVQSGHHLRITVIRLRVQQVLHLVIAQLCQSALRSASLAVRCVTYTSPTSFYTQQGQGSLCQQSDLRLRTRNPIG